MDVARTSLWPSRTLSVVGLAQRLCPDCIYPLCKLGSACTPSLLPWFSPLWRQLQRGSSRTAPREVPAAVGMSVALRGRLHNEIRGIQRAASSLPVICDTRCLAVFCPSPVATRLPKLQGGHFQFLLHYCCPLPLKPCCLLSPLFCSSSVLRTYKNNKSHLHLKAFFLLQFGFLWLQS